MGLAGARKRDLEAGTSKPWECRLAESRRPACWWGSLAKKDALRPGNWEMVGRALGVVVLVDDDEEEGWVVPRWEWVLLGWLLPRWE